MARLALVVITLNEEKNIERCLSSASGLADELIVVDSGSHDRTIELAQQMGAKVIFHPSKTTLARKITRLARLHPIGYSLSMQMKRSPTH